MRARGTFAGPLAALLASVTLAAGATLAGCATNDTTLRATGQAAGFSVRPYPAGYVVTVDGRSYRCEGQRGRASRRLLEDVLSEGVRQGESVPKLGTEARFNCL